MTVTTLPKPAWASAITSAEKTGEPNSILLYGVPGTRKTTIAASIAEVSGFKKVLLIDTDGGTAVLSLDKAYANIDILKIDPLAPGAKAKLDSVIDDICVNDYGYDAVVLDVLDISQDIVERELKLKYAGSKNTFAVYGELGEWTDTIVRKLHNAPHFVAIITAHSQEKQLDSGALRITPKLSGSSKDAIGGVPDVVAYLSFVTHPETGEPHLVASVGQSDSTISKNRYRLQSSIVDFTMPVLYGLIREKITAVTNNPVAVAA